MPWMETSPVDQREQFIRDHRLDMYAMAELCARYGISRRTGYKWLARFVEAERARLRDRSRAPPPPHGARRRRGNLCGAPTASELGTG
jgi:putative transposase